MLVETLADTRKLVDVQGAEMANKHLDLGWELLEKNVTGYGDPGERNETVRFVLRWTKEDEPVFPKSQFDDSPNHGF